MLIHIRGISGDPQFRDLVVGRMQSVLERARVRAATGSVTFTDENGPKGGRDIRCALVVAIPGRGSLKVAEVAANHELAFNQGVAAFERKVTEQRDRRRVLARRPKKYFVAKRLLTEETFPARERRAARIRDSRS
jgi:hypothetical protein